MTELKTLNDLGSNTVLAACPYCGGAATYYENSDGQAAAIYCTVCPLGVEDNRMDFDDLKEVWNGLPRTVANGKGEQPAANEPNKG